MPGRSSKARTPEAIAAHSKRLSDLKAANQKRKGTDPNEGKNPHAGAPGKLGAKGFGK